MTGYSWDTSASTVNDGYGINEWSQADLMKLLNPGYESNTDLNSSGTSITVNNSLYWNKGSGTCYNDESNATTTCNFTSTGLGTTAQGMIDTVKYYTAGWNSNSITSQQYYTYERGSAVVSSPLDGVTRTTSWIGKIGLMYVSDYGYAADPSTCSRTNKLYPDYYNTTPTCHTNNWLWDSSRSQWTIVPSSSYSHNAWNLSSGGGVLNGSAYYYGSAWRSVLYLKSDVRIDAGSGTVGDPYILSE